MIGSSRAECRSGRGLAPSAVRKRPASAGSSLHDCSAETLCLTSLTLPVPLLSMASAMKGDVDIGLWLG